MNSYTLNLSDGSQLAVYGGTEHEALESTLRTAMREAWEHAGTDRGLQARRIMLAIDRYLKAKEVNA